MRQYTCSLHRLHIPISSAPAPIPAPFPTGPTTTSEDSTKTTSFKSPFKYLDMPAPLSPPSLPSTDSSLGWRTDSPGRLWSRAPVSQHQVLRFCTSVQSQPPRTTFSGSYTPMCPPSPPPPSNTSISSSPTTTPMATSPLATRICRPTDQSTSSGIV